MGCCFSSLTTDSSPSSTAKVIAVDGTLMEYPHPIAVSKALGINRLSCFICNSDHLQIDSYIPQLDLSAYIQLGQIYFILPNANTKCRLAGNDMAVLAVKASSALALSSERNRRRTKERKNSVALFCEEFGELNGGSNENTVRSKKNGSTSAVGDKSTFKRILSIIEE